MDIRMGQVPAMKNLTSNQDDLPIFRCLDDISKLSDSKNGKKNLNFFFSLKLYIFYKNY